MYQCLTKELPEKISHYYYQIDECHKESRRYTSMHLGRSVPRSSWSVYVGMLSRVAYRLVALLDPFDPPNFLRGVPLSSEQLKTE